jgi:hypothetical protein
VSKSATKVLASTDHGRGTLEEGQLAFGKARGAISAGDGQAMRDIHVELKDLDREASELAAKIQANFEGLGI